MTGNMWDEVPDYMRPMTPEDFKGERVARFEREFSDKFADAKRHARGFRHLQLGYRETEENHILGPDIPEWHIVCELCGGSVLRLMSGGQPHNFDPVWLETAVIRHLHMRHAEMIGVKESGEYGENEALDRPGSGLLRHSYDRATSRLRNQERYSESG
jgi:hypothetical protein